ncbi:hypothetical protein BGZ97_007747, partial [Linnemannia gamsii]
MALVLSIATATASTTSSASGLVARAAPTDCDQCLEDNMIRVQPACANLPVVGTINEFSD